MGAGLGRGSFQGAADSLQTKQNAIAGFLNRASQVQAAVVGHGASPADTPAKAASAQPAERPAILPADDTDASQLTVMPGPVEPQPRTARPVKSSLLDGMVRRVAGLFRAVSVALGGAPQPMRDIAALYAQHPGLRVLTQQTIRVAHIGRSESVLMARTKGALGQGVGNLRDVMRRTGINPDAFTRKIANDEGVGGPEIPLDQVHIAGISDPGFTHAYLGAAAVLDQLNGLSAAMDHVPLSAPVPDAKFDRSSGFGARIDPFTGRYAFHPGVDFAGPWGAVVHATAPGTVVFAGNRGGYGNMVEVDHGYGIHTRYGHLSSDQRACRAPMSTGARAWGGSGPPDAAPARTSIMKCGMTTSSAIPTTSSRLAAMFSSRSKESAPAAQPMAPAASAAAKRGRALSAPSIISGDMAIDGHPDLDRRHPDRRHASKAMCAASAW